LLVQSWFFEIATPISALITTLIEIDEERNADPTRNMTQKLREIHAIITQITRKIICSPENSRYFPL
jgi:hypothetical protein